MTALSEIKSMLKNKGLHLNKELGQHLLIDPNIRKMLIQSADITNSDFVIEIGPGTGYMTEEIVKTAGKVAAIEIDRGLTEYLREKFNGIANLNIIHEDVLKADINSICYVGIKSGYSVKIIGNLPYNINAPIIIRIAQLHTLPVLCCFVVQKEAALRYAAEPGTKLYGSIAVFLQYRFAMRQLFKISNDSFFPRPDVQSAAILLMPHAVPPSTVMDEPLFFKLIRTAFAQRRKMLRNSLKFLNGFEKNHYVIEDALHEAGISPAERPENLPLKAFADIANALHKAIT